MNPYLDEDLTMLAEQARRFATGRVAPDFLERDQTRVLDRTLMREMGQMGFHSTRIAITAWQPRPGLPGSRCHSRRNCASRPRYFLCQSAGLVKRADSGAPRHAGDRQTLANPSSRKVKYCLRRHSPSRAVARLVPIRALRTSPTGL